MKFLLEMRAAQRPRAFLQGALVAGLMLSACAVQAPNEAAGKRLSTGPTSRPAPHATASGGTEGASATPAVTPTPVPSPLPTVAGTLLSGLMRIDASYVIAAGAGNVIAAGSGNVIAAGSGNVIAAGSGNVIAAGSGNVIAAGSGNVIAAGSGNVIAAGSGNYRLFAASCTATQPAPATPTGTLDPLHVPPGTVLPASGAVVVPVSLTTGKVLGPAVFTDATGHYTVSVPKGSEHDVLLIAAMPGKSADDPIVKDTRLQYPVLESLGATGTPEIDEDTATVTRYLRATMQNRLDGFIQPAYLASDATDTPLLVPALSASEATFVNLEANATRDQVKQARFITGDPAKDAPNVRELAKRLGDTLCSQIDLSHVGVDGTLHLKWNNAPIGAPVMPLMLGLMRDVRQAADAKLAVNPHYFDTAPYIVAANQSLPAGTAPYVIRKGSDVSDFIVNYYYAKTAIPDEMQSRVVMIDLGLACDDTQADQIYYELETCADSIILKMLPLLVSEQALVDGTIASFTPTP